MRIIAGKYGGRNIDEPSGNKTHPMSEKMRGAIFNALGDIEGLEVLDAYAGSGAVGIEALSRGAKFAYFVEKDKKAAETIRKNLDGLKISDEAKVTQANISSWLENNPNRNFDIIVADPPYDKLNSGSLLKLSKHLSDKGILVLSLPPDQLVSIEGANIVKEKSYGDSKLVFLKSS